MHTTNLMVPIWRRADER